MVLFKEFEEWHKMSINSNISKYRLKARIKPNKLKTDI